METSSRQKLGAAAIALAVAILFSQSAGRQVGDSRFELLTTENLLHHHTLTLDRNVSQIPWTYQLVAANGHVFHYFPPGGSLLALPIVALANAFGWSIADASGAYNLKVESTLQALLASVLMGVLAGVTYLTARLLLPPGWSALITLATALGSQMWSTASRALWSQTWGIFLLGFVLLILLAQARGRFRAHPILLGTLLSWLYFARPTFAIHIVGIMLYLLLSQRALVWKTAVTGVLWLGAFAFFSWINFHTLLPPYYLSRLGPEDFWTAFAGNFVSPSRGLLIMVPSVWVIGFLLVRHWSRLPHRTLAAVALGIIPLHIAVHSASAAQWHAGHCYGPRFCTDLVPWLSMLAMLAVAAMREERPSASRLAHRIQWATALLLVALSVAMHARGALSNATAKWNYDPINVDQDPHRVWDWREPQFLAGLVPPASPR